MIGEANSCVREAAEQFARDSHIEVSGIRQANNASLALMAHVNTKRRLVLCNPTDKARLCYARLAISEAGIQQKGR